jgi:hypothetical protein
MQMPQYSKQRKHCNVILPMFRFEVIVDTSKASVKACRGHSDHS